MRWMMMVLATALFAAPVAAQTGASARDAWMRMPVGDARLRVEPAVARPDTPRAAEWAPRPAVHWMLIGGAVGCAGGALIMSSGAAEGEKTASGFNGCILGGSAGIFLGGLYGLVTGG